MTRTDRSSHASAAAIIHNATRLEVKTVALFFFFLFSPRNSARGSRTLGRNASRSIIIRFLLSSDDFPTVVVAKITSANKYNRKRANEKKLKKIFLPLQSQFITNVSFSTRRNSNASCPKQHWSTSQPASVCGLDLYVSHV